MKKKVLNRAVPASFHSWRKTKTHTGVRMPKASMSCSTLVKCTKPASARGPSKHQSPTDPEHLQNCFAIVNGIHSNKYQKKKKVQVFFTQVRFLPKAEPIQTGKERGLSGLRSWGQGQEAGRRKRNSTSWCLKALPSRNAETIAASS